MDIKIDGITPELMREALSQARDARIHILNVMNEAISAPRKTVSKYAPSILTTKIAESKIGELIGPGGKNIKALQEATGAVVNIAEDGTVQIAGKTQEIAKLALERINAQMEEPEIGRTYTAKVKTLVDFGAFVEYLPNKEGLVHISELDDKRVQNVNDYLKEGDIIDVKLIGMDKGKVRLSLKAAKALD
jgi:polyribonucleotide nucleotidyltransferase